ncbi:MAG: RluA family pseudouridine synthase, partial [Proteobacteria bacterium]|nr:RluA family pseudouridine synthase [Pseudomonadota bacterium]
RIDNFLLRELKPVPRSRIYQMLRKGEVRVNGGRVRPTYRLNVGDRVRIPPVRLAEVQIVNPGEGIRNAVRDSVVYQDDKIMVLNKPSGIAVHGGSGVSAGVIETLRTLYPADTLELVHRLDRETSGILVVARKRSALRDLHEQFRNGSVRKKYQLLVHGHWPEKVSQVHTSLTRYVTSSGERRVRPDPQGKAARTDFSVVHAADSASWLQADLHTGRTHQIRVHALSIGHPVLGDDKSHTAGSFQLSETLGVRRLCLHATSMALTVGETQHRFVCEPPALFAKVWKRLST